MSHSALESLQAASLEVASNERAPCEKCMDQAELQAVILFPALGTPYIAPVSEKTIKVYLVAEEKCLSLFDITVGGKGRKAPLAWYVINKHLRLTAFKDEGKTKADLKSGSLYGSRAAAQAGIKVWYRGAYAANAGASKYQWGNQIHDHDGKIVANLRQSAVDFFVGACAAYGPMTPAHALDRKLADVSNQPLSYLFEIELSVDGLRVKPSVNQVYTLSWMVTCVYRQAKNEAGRPVLPGVTEWEHQDKLIYDFLWLMKQKKQHFVKPFAFDVAATKQAEIGKQFSDEANRLKAYHPVMFKNKAALHIGHLTDVHVSSRHFALAKSEAQVIPGASAPIGPSVTNSFVALKELFDNIRKAGADTIFLTGDLIDFNQNFEPSRLTGGPLRDDWAMFDLAKQFKNNQAIDSTLYPRGLDDMLTYSLLKYSCLHNCPVFLTVGNHEAYDVPYGVAPRLNGRGIAQTYQQTVELRKRMAEREERATKLEKQASALESDDSVGNHAKVAELREQAAKTRAEILPGEPVAPARLTESGSTWMTDPAARAEAMQPAAQKMGNVGRTVRRAFGGDGDEDSPFETALKSIKRQFDIESNNAYEYSESRANEGVPADHNLTIFEACMAYGPSYAQLVKAWNFTPSNLDWFFMIFTPLADYQVHYGDSQCLIGLDWGDSEVMINADMNLEEARKTLARGRNKPVEGTGFANELSGTWNAIKSEFQGALTGLPRSNKSLNRPQQKLLQDALAGGKTKNVLFTHFTLINYDMNVTYAGQSLPFELSDASFNEYTKGSFSVRREWLLGQVVNNGLHYALSGHSHRAGVYRLNNQNVGAATVRAYEPALPGDDTHSDVHRDLFSSAKPTRIIVSSCGGPIGVQNVDDGMLGWNLRPPSGTLLKTDVTGLDECRRITANTKQSTPRFCVMLDYLWVLHDIPGITWVPEWLSKDPKGKQVVNEGKRGSFLIVPNVLKDYAPYIESIDIFAYSQRKSTFARFGSELSAVSGANDPMLRMTISNWSDLIALVNVHPAPPTFAKVTFNKKLAVTRLYAHYNFDDPLIFPTQITDEGIARPKGEVGEVPQFVWLSKTMPDSFGYTGLPHGH